MNRREFLRLAAALSAAPVFGGAGGNQPVKGAAGEVPRRKLGKTGETVSMIGLGGFHIGKQKTEQESIRIIRTAIDKGLNFLDNSWDYNGGESERREGKALREGYRAKAFLMTKIDGRDAKTAARQIDESLRRLQTDHLDLLQLHEVIRDNDPERAFAVGGAIEAMVAAQQAGKTRFLGFTGHKSPAIHLKMLATARSHRFRFDTVQMPLNVMDAHFSSFEKNVLPELVKDEIGVLGMKSMGDGFILSSKVVEPEECLRYSLSLPTSVVVTGIDSMGILDQALRVARNFRVLTEAEVETLLAKTAVAAKEGQYEKYKVSEHFDSTASHPEWLGKTA